MVRVRKENGRDIEIEEFNYIYCRQRADGLYEVKLNDGSMGIVITKQMREEEDKKTSEIAQKWLDDRYTIGDWFREE